MHIVHFVTVTLYAYFSFKCWALTPEIQL